MKTQSLYNIQNDYLLLMSEIEQAEGELTEEQNNALVINEKELQQKSVAYLEVIKTQEAFIGMIDEEIKRLQAIKKRKLNLIQRLKNMLLNAVMLFDGFTIGTLTFSSSKSSAVVIDDEDLIDKEYKTIKVTTTVNKTAIKNAIKEGTEVKGARVQENFNLKIK